MARHRRGLVRARAPRPRHPLPAPRASASSASRRRCRSASRCGATTTAPTTGKHYQLAETICSPDAHPAPRPPILIGGSGEKKTLRLVARYADACNVRSTNPEDTERLLSILDEHCHAIGRDPATIERTIVTRFDPGANGERASQEVDRLAKFAEHRRPGCPRLHHQRPGPRRHGSHGHESHPRPREALTRPHLGHGIWYGWRDSNPRPSVPKTDALIH